MKASEKDQVVWEPWLTGVDSAFVCGRWIYLNFKTKQVKIGWNSDDGDPTPADLRTIADACEQKLREEAAK